MLGRLTVDVELQVFAIGRWPAGSARQKRAYLIDKRLQFKTQQHVGKLSMSGII